MKTISPSQFKQVLANKAEDEICIDVRTPAEYRGIHIEGVENIPLDTLSSKMSDLKQYSTIYVHCETGARAERACKMLQASGINDTVRMKDGTDKWEAGGLPVIKGASSISVMRQVQITAGGLTLLGVVLGFFVHSYWFYLSGFIGAGLLFAGLSGTCAMATILGKMPWNQ